MIGTASNRANFENRVIYAHFWPISSYQAPKSKTYGASGQYVSKKSENWYLGSSYVETIGFRRPALKKGFFILRNTLIYTDTTEQIQPFPFPLQPKETVQDQVYISLPLCYHRHIHNIWCVAPFLPL